MQIMNNGIEGFRTAATQSWFTDTNMMPSCEQMPQWSLRAPENVGDINDTTFEELLVAWSLLQMYGGQAFESETPVSPMITLPERLATLLLDLADQQSGLIQGMTYQVFADYLGTYRETIGALLRAFVRQGFVELGCLHIQIVDRESLKVFAGEAEWQ